MTPTYGSWEVVRKIGSGSFGKVYEIQKKEYGYTYKAALKVISIPQSDREVESARLEGMDDTGIRQYFLSIVQEIVKEYEVMFKLQGNTNIVNYENHMIKEHENGIGWDVMIQMELLTSLNQYIRNHSFSRRDVICLGIDICRALERCQKFNIIHRDIKLDNIFVSKQGDYKLGDFGIARTVEKTMLEMSKKGTYSYMAPEIYRGGAYGFSVDTYSLGIVMYRLLNNNRTPFMPPYPVTPRYQDQEIAIRRRMSGEALPYPANDHTRLAEIVLKATAYDPKERYSSPTQMREELEAILYSETERERIIKDDRIAIPLFNTTMSRNSDSNSNNLQATKEDETISAVSSQKKPKKKTEGKKKSPLRILLFFALFAVLCSGSVFGWYMLTTVSIPPVRGMKFEEAKTVLALNKLNVVEGNPENSEMIERGHVIRVKESGRQKKNSKVTVIVSLGKAIEVPMVIKKEGTLAQKELEEAGLLVNLDNKEYSYEYKKGVVMDQDQPEGTILNEGDTINLTISKGPKPFKLAKYVGKTYDAAKKDAEKLGLIVKKKESFSMDVKKGNIISQNIQSGKKVRKGDTITFTVSKGIEQIKVPSVVGKSESSARESIEDAGFNFDHYYEYSSSVDSGYVIAQDKDAGTKINKGSTIIVAISRGPKPVERSSSSSSKKSNKSTNKSTNTSSGSSNSNGSGVAIIDSSKLPNDN